MTSVTIDAKGRLAIPRELREALDIAAGDVLFVEADAETGVIHLAKAINPFDALADDALAEYRAGRTKDLRAYAAEHDIDVGVDE